MASPNQQGSAARAYPEQAAPGTGTPDSGRLRLADHYDAELRRHNERFRAATGIGPGDRVLDVGCGGGQSTRDAARDAGSGAALGVDSSEQMLERARRLTEQEGLPNVTYELGDVQSIASRRSVSTWSSAGSARCSSLTRSPRSPTSPVPRGPGRAW